MAKECPLKKLSILELRILLEHIRLGLAHLKSYLNNQQLNDFLSEGELTSTERERLKFTAREKTGSVALVINMIFTSVLGAWLAVAGFMRIELLPRNFLLSVIFIAVLLACYFGYYNFKATKKKVREAFLNQKLHNLEYKLLGILQDKYKHNNQKSVVYLHKTINDLASTAEGKALVNLPQQENQLKTPQDVEAVFHQLNTVLEKRVEKQSHLQVYSLYIAELRKFKLRLKKRLTKNLPLKNSAKTSWHIQVEPQKASPLQRLTTPYFELKKIKFNSRIWLKENFIPLMKDLIPTALGGLGSMFVYFGGGTELAKACHSDILEKMLDQPAVRFICLAIVLGITLYLAYTYVHNNRKSYEREKLLQKTKTDIANEEKDLIEEVTRYNVLKKVENILKQLSNVFYLLECFEKSL